MIGREPVIAVIPARGGSKRLPGKNLADLDGRPLIAWTIAASLAAPSVDRTIVSSDNPAIIAAALSAGAEAPFKRPEALSDDTASSADVLMHALDETNTRIGFAVLLQPTSPMRIASDIEACITLCADTGAPSAVSVAEMHQKPAWLYRRMADSRIRPLMFAPPDGPAVMLNGAIYVVHVPWFRATKQFITEDTVGYVMPRSRSVDIDDEVDLAVARTLVGIQAPRSDDQ
jgi:CMP-N,N'-diacetyllegionaminic acid synthase